MWGASARAHVHAFFARWCLHARSSIADEGVILVYYVEEANRPFISQFCLIPLFRYHRNYAPFLCDKETIYICIVYVFCYNLTNVVPKEQEKFCRKSSHSRCFIFVHSTQCYFILVTRYNIIASFSFWVG